MGLTNEKATAPVLSAATDKGQPLSQKLNDSIPGMRKESNGDFDARPQANAPDYLHTVSLTELFDTVYPPKAQVVENFLVAGAYLFVGAPKVGKSFFVAQLGYHVSSGMPLWDYPTHKGAVLYLALEDNHSRLQKRISRMFGTDGTDNYHLATDAKNWREGLDGQLSRFMREHPDTKLIIIDTLQKTREVGGEKYSYASDYEIVTHFKHFADRHNICVLLVHHSRKQGAEDIFDTISGTNGLLGAADGALIMQKGKRTENEAVIEIVGRDFQDQRLHLLFDRERCIWQLTKSETELWVEPPDPLLEAVSKLVAPECPEWSGNASELMERLGALCMQPNVLTRKLNIGADRLWNEYGIRFESIRSHAGRSVRLMLDRPTT